MNAYCPPAPCPPSGPQPPFPPYPPFPANPKPGDRFGSWIWNGSQWVVSTATGTTINTQVFKATGNYQPSPGLTSIVVECVGGGGGGGGSSSNFVNSAGGGWSSGGGGGGSGGYSRVTLPAALVMGGAAVTVGAGGAGAAAGAPNAPAQPGGNGGDTSFAGYCIAHGGGGGGEGDVGITGGGLGGGGGAGGAKGVGDITTTGASGVHGTDLYQAPGSPAGVANVWGGNGGASFFGGSGAGNVSFPGGPQQGLQTSGMDGGGGGGASTGVQSSPGGGSNGGIGICVVTEYITLPAPNSGSGTSQPSTTCCPCCGQPVSSCGCTQTGNAPVPFDAVLPMAGRRW